MVSKKQIPLDLEKLIENLSKSGIKYILIGGMAAIAHGAPVFTFDLDIVHERSDENLKKIKDLLISLDACQRRPDDMKLTPDFEALKGTGHILLSTRFGPMDILGAIEKGFGYDDLINHVIEIEFHGFNIHVLDLETLIELKKESTRPEDRHRLSILEDTLKQIKQGD
ncbi:MAG: hypothetical protein MI863_13095 [Desulfobacterales bacterium]|nr:hypothetical protein [Desulfobacterales bacterium]